MQRRHSLPGKPQLLPGLNARGHNKLPPLASKRLRRRFPAEGCNGIRYRHVKQQVLAIALKLGMRQHMQAHHQVRLAAARIGRALAWMSNLHLIPCTGWYRNLRSEERRVGKEC